MARIVIAYTFLAGRRRLFTGFRWPVGEWVEVDSLEPCRGGIRVALDCADVCEATARIATRQSQPDIRLVRATIEACAAACIVCAEECDRRAAHHEHCRICADVWPTLQRRMRRSARLLTTGTPLRDMDESGRVERRRRLAGGG